jgi:hypothetical protein
LVVGALRLAGVWLSPAILFGTAPLLLADGTRGLWPPLVLAVAAPLVVVLLAAPWARLPAGGHPTLLDLVRQRASTATDAGLPLAVAVPGSAVLFLWAQLAAGRELARALAWPEAAVLGIGLLGLALGGWTERVERRLAATGGALAAAGLVLPLVVVGGATDPAWSRVWNAVASRPRVVYEGPGAEVPEAQPVRGPGQQADLRISEEQRLMLLGRGSVRLDRDGGGWTREVTGPLALSLRPGDRLVVPDGFPVRFQPGRAIPGAPPTGADWVDPGDGGGGPRRLAGLAVTLLVGVLGLAPVHGALPSGRLADDRAAALGAVLAAVGLAAAVLWALSAAWLTPEIYAGGVIGSEVYELPGRVAGRVGPARALGGLVWLGLVGGGLAAGLAALRGVPSSFGAAGSDEPRRPPAIRLAVLGLAGLLAMLGPADAWPVLLAAFGLAASACAPAAVLACWRERISPTGLEAGAGVGLAAFLALTAIHLAGGGGTADRSWLGWLAAWPALAAAPLNVLTAWLLSSGPRPSPRTPLPPGLAELHG